MFRTDLRQNLARYMQEAVDGGAPILVIRHGGKGDVVIVSAAEFAGMEATLHLLRSPANARRLLRSVQSAEAGSVKERDLAQPEHKDAG